MKKIERGPKNRSPTDRKKAEGSLPVMETLNVQLKRQEENQARAEKQKSKSSRRR